jgi:beta-ureidopropionase / N-carbamoyl-L-amino-acid hydrolase
MASATGMLEAIAGVGADRARGGVSRHGFDRADLELREWFTEQAGGRGLDVSVDRNGNLWAWWGPPGPDAVVTGSHLDSVPSGGVFDGPLGVVSALAAVDILRAKNVTPNRPLAIVVFAEEEGSRFGVPCLGSRLLTGAIDAHAARRLIDRDGVRLAEAVSKAGLDPRRLGRDAETLSRIGRFVELHVEQGRGLVERAAPVGLASTILAHGRWRFRFTGEANHAGTTPLRDRHDPMLPACGLVLTARQAAAQVPHGRATVGRLVPNPGGTNVIPSTVDVWLDARAPQGTHTRLMVDRIITQARQQAAEEGCRMTVTEESYSDTMRLDRTLAGELSDLLGGVPTVATGAGHDAGILARHVPTAMLFVRNPTGVSHAPAEHAEPADCEAGVAALAAVLGHLAQ